MNTSLHEREQRIRGIAASIVAYLKEHHRAADTARGVHDWWLAKEDVGLVARTEVEQALESLVANGQMTRTGAFDGLYTYNVLGEASRRLGPAECA